MNLPSYFKKSSEQALSNTSKAQENKPHTMNVKKGYE
jgi:hypothetical protein